MPFPPCRLKGCGPTPHRHTSHSMPYRFGEARVDLRYDGRSPAAQVEAVYVPRRGPERVVAQWRDASDALEWLEKTAAHIRQSYELPEPAA